MPMRTIGQLASAANVGVETVRYYERIGLIAKPPSTQAGWRRYPDSTLQALRQIRRGRQLGFRLDELIGLFGSGHTSQCASLATAAREKI
ncbi:MAG TPA: MerR family transcriptional regulator, partial [Gammaproteobacteria bacterium]|nr:MerR family transcriptional regulator [Gammaproteobacteria bacterium]